MCAHRTLLPPELSLMMSSTASTEPSEPIARFVPIIYYHYHYFTCWSLKERTRARKQSILKMIYIFLKGGWGGRDDPVVEMNCLIFQYFLTFLVCSTCEIWSMTVRSSLLTTRPSTIWLALLPPLRQQRKRSHAGILDGLS